MTPVHLHLLINHLPIVGTMLGVPLLLVALWRRTELGVAVGAAIVLALSGAGAVVAEESGEEAEDVAERLPDVSEALIEAHEERAETAVPLAVLVGVLAVGAAGLRVWRPGTLATAATGVALAANLASAGAMALVGQSGGQIRHTEVRPGVAPAAGTNAGEDDGDED